jgi:uroporphyrinogen-III decarboxylase
MSIGEIRRNLDKLGCFADSSENKRRISLFDEESLTIHGDVQFHGIPRDSIQKDGYMPVTAECLNELWMQKFHFELDRYYTDPEYYLDIFLKIKLAKYEIFGDDTPIDRNILISFATVFEAATLGVDVSYHKEIEPSFKQSSIINDYENLATDFDFENNTMVEKAKYFYKSIKDIVGDEFNVIFPPWFRGPQGVALYLRGYDKFLIDLYVNPDFVHKILRYVTNAAKEYTTWRAEFCNEEVGKGDLFNDDIPLMSPDDYEQFILPYEQELCSFYNGIKYWHSCGDITKHIPRIDRIHTIDLLDIGVAVDDKFKAANYTDSHQCIEFRFLASKYIQSAGVKDMRKYMTDFIIRCRESGIKRYVIRTSGMGILNDATEDLKKLSNWVDITKELQYELE